MKRRANGELQLSATDLMTFQGCRHAASLDIQALKGNGPVPKRDDAAHELLRRKGIEHESAWLEQLEAKGMTVHRAPFESASPGVAAETTRALLAEGHEVVSQASFSSPPWGGRADFLERVDLDDAGTAFGSFGYEPLDTKLKRSPHPQHVLQLALYADMLAALQGRDPDDIHIILGDHSRTTLRLKEYAAYARRARSRMEAFIAAPPKTEGAPVEACGDCRWSDACAQEWEQKDALWRVAGISASQVAKLQGAGVTTLTQLAAREERVPKLADAMLGKLSRQARLQLGRDRGGAPTFELREIETGRGLSLLPRPAKGDLFFDMEGNPMVEGGLEYLFGVYHETGRKEGEGEFLPWWAHDRAAEGEATADLLHFFAKHLERHPEAHIYHYAQYEVTALKRLVCQHGVAEATLDRLLRENRFIDLYRVVSQGMVCSERGYSIKDLEAFYREKRAEEVATAADSIIAYERWCETEDQKILDDICEYNRIDCVSTKELRDWLVREVRPKDLPWREFAAPQDRKEQEDGHEEIAARFAPHRARLGDELVDLLVHLCTYHRREAKPAWWRHFDLREQEAEVLVDDLDCLGALEAIGPVEPEKQSKKRLYRFPDQETKLRRGSQVCFGPEGLRASVLDVDRSGRQATIKFGPKAGTPPEALSLYPEGPVETKQQRGAVRRVAEGLCAPDGSRPAISRFLKGEAPHLKARAPGAPVAQDGADVVEGLVRAVRDMDGAVLPVQGPPGTGKTYASSVAILKLLQDGKRVAVSSNSHDAIDNLFDAVFARAAEQGVTIEGVRKPKGGCTRERPEAVSTTTDNKDARLTSMQLVGGVAWLLCRPEHDRSFDYLFIDEAGQVSLADMVALSACAKNVVLVGDPMQLPQVRQASHPGRSGLSALEYVLDGRQTIPPEEGVFLPTTRRLHPGICSWVSEIVYEGRLGSFEGCERQTITCTDGKAEAGIRFEPVAHTGCGQVSEEEVERVVALYESFLGAIYTDRQGRERRMSMEDVLVVAPYNAQVNALGDALPEGARFGTVDKFQGQEAPVCIISMTTSSAAEMPRDLSFLLSLNRLNVGVSRAQALAIVVASPELMDLPVRSIEEMRLVSAFCSLT